MTWWFRAGVCGLLLLVAYAFYRSRVRTILEVEGLRLRIARDLHDDIGTNLSAIVLASEMGKRSLKKAATPEAFEDIRTMAMLTQEHMRDIVWMLNPRNDSTPRLLARMKDDAGRLLRPIPHTFSGPPGTLPGEISLAQKRNIFLIYKEALHNILKHSRAKHVDIAVGFEGNILNLSIADDGRGFDPRTVERGNGLDSMTARAAQIQAELRITSRPRGGTTVQLRTKIT
jgi:signal transduction histidine kinase